MATKELTPEQRELIPIVRQKWFDAALGGDSSVAPLNVLREHVDWFYRSSQKAEPKIIFTVRSNISAQLGMNALRLTLENMENGVGADRPDHHTADDPVLRSAMEDVYSQCEDQANRVLADCTVKWDRAWNAALPLILNMKPGVKSDKYRWYPFAWTGIGLNSAWCSLYDFFTQIGVLEHPDFRKYCDFVMCGIWDSILLDGVACIVRRPTKVVLDAKNRLHNPEGPCVTWLDGHAHWAVSGVMLENPDWVSDKTKLTGERILNEGNAEVRRVMMEQLGYAEFISSLRKSGHKISVLDQDKDGAGQPRMLIKVDLDKGERDEPLVVVCVKCPSTGHEFVLRVPPNMTKCHEAVSWTFQKDPKVYAPLVEA